MMTSLILSLLAVAPSLIEVPNDSLRNTEETMIERIVEQKPGEVLNQKVPTVKNTLGLFQMRPWTEATETTIEITVPSWVESLGFTVREETEIQLGDRVRAVIKNPKTGINMAESNEIEIRY